MSTDASGYSNLLCHVYVSDHWNFVDHTVSAITIAVSSDAVVTQVSAVATCASGAAVASLSSHWTHDYTAATSSHHHDETVCACCHCLVRTT